LKLSLGRTTPIKDKHNIGERQSQTPRDKTLKGDDKGADNGDNWQLAI